MFTGSVNADMRRVIDEIVSQWDVKDVYIGCSGNFTIENILKGNHRPEDSDQAIIHPTLRGE